MLCVKILKQTHLSNGKCKLCLIGYIPLNKLANVESKLCLTDTIVRNTMVKFN